MQKVIPWAALLIAIIACVVSLYAALRPMPCPDEAAIEQRVYRRIVGEVAHELTPVYQDFDIDAPGEPETLTELLKPLLSVESQLTNQPATGPATAP